MPLRPKHLGVLVFPKDKDTLLHGHSPAIEIRSISAVTSFAATSRKSRSLCYVSSEEPSLPFVLPQSPANVTLLP